MKFSSSDKLDRQKGCKYDMPCPSGGGTWDQLQDQMKAKQNRHKNLKGLHNIYLLLICQV